MPNARGAEIEAGHVLYVDEPEKFNALVDGFLKS
jgi:pimeloyl-ACP methyl ester carboxylesterase